jgi:hypothetical protein
VGNAHNQTASEQITELRNAKVLAALGLRALRDIPSAKLYFERSDQRRANAASPMRGTLPTRTSGESLHRSARTEERFAADKREPSHVIIEAEVN